jgi:predicted Fe-Mo cluster-binding NifX family protein
MYQMKIAISSTGKNLESEIDARFGRCPYFLIAEVDNKEIESVKAIENTAAGQTGGAGITAAEIVANEKVNAVITADLGPRAFSVFEQLDIKIYQGQGKIKDVIQQFIEGKLTEITDSTGPQHMGFK